MAPPGGASSADSTLTRPQRLCVGLLILLLVDVIWVASSEFTKYIFTELSYDKPYFSTYFKNSLFASYLLGFVIYRPWRHQLLYQTSRSALTSRQQRRLRRRQGRLYRQILQNDDEDEDGDGGGGGAEGVGSDGTGGRGGSGNSEHRRSDERELLSTSSGNDDLSDGSEYGTIRRSLSSPTFVPANIPSESGKSSGNESDGIVSVVPNGNTSQHSQASAAPAEGDEDEILIAGMADTPASRRVRFSKQAEVVEMNPAEAIAANLSRLSYNASLRAQMALRRAANRLTVWEVFKISLGFTFPFLAGQYCYQRALALTEAAVVNILSASSCVFTLLLSGVFPSEPSDRITVSKVFAVLFNFCGVVLVSYADIERQGGSGGGGGGGGISGLVADAVGRSVASVAKSADLAGGVAWALAGALFYAVYIVLLRRKVNNEDNMDPPMFFGFVGIFTALLAWPGIIAVQGLGVEHFDWPTSKQLEFLVVNGLIGTVLSELLWLCGCFYTSSLIATCAMALTIPMSIAADVFWKHKTYHPIFIMGAIPMFCSFFVIVLLTHYQDWDPVLDLFKTCFSKCCCCFLRGGRHNSTNVGSGRSEAIRLRPHRTPVTVNASEQDLQENQSLIESADSDEVSANEISVEDGRRQLPPSNTNHASDLL